MRHKGVSKYLLMIIFLSVTSFGGVCAQVKDSIILRPAAESDECLIHFRGNQSFVDSGYMNNAKELSHLKNTFVFRYGLFGRSCFNLCKQLSRW